MVYQKKIFFQNTKKISSKELTQFLKILILSYENNAKKFRLMESKGDFTYKDYNLAKFEDIYFLHSEHGKKMQIIFNDNN